MNASSSNTTDWQHVVFTWSGTDYARIFINGTQAAETTNFSSGTLTLESGDSFNIGKRFSGGGAQHFDGMRARVQRCATVVSAETDPLITGLTPLKGGSHDLRAPKV